MVSETENNPERECQFLLGKVQHYGNRQIHNRKTGLCQFLLGKVQRS